MFYITFYKYIIESYKYSTTNNGRDEKHKDNAGSPNSFSEQKNQNRRRKNEQGMKQSNGKQTLYNKYGVNQANLRLPTSEIRYLSISIVLIFSNISTITYLAHLYLPLF